MKRRRRRARDRRAFRSGGDLGRQRRVNTQVNVMTHALDARRRSAAPGWSWSIDTYRTGDRRSRPIMHRLRCVPGTDGALAVRRHACAVSSEGYADWDYLAPLHRLRPTSWRRHVADAIRRSGRRSITGFVGRRPSLTLRPALSARPSARFHPPADHGFSRQPQRRGQHACGELPCAAVTGAWKVHEGGGALYGTTAARCIPWEKTLIEGHRRGRSRRSA